MNLLQMSYSLISCTACAL